MYIKVKKYKDYPERSYLQIVESYREDKKVRNRVVLNLGRFDTPDAIGKIEQMIETLLPLSTKYSDLDLKRDISAIESKQFGPLLIFQKLWQELGLGEALKQSVSDIPTFFDIERAVFNMVLNRLVSPSSKRQMLRFQDSVYGISKFDLHQYYRAMDYLIANKEKIEKGVLAKVKAQIKGKIDLAFYDTTTLVYHGDDKEEHSELLDYGFSKDRRSDLKQIVIGVLMSKEGLPLGHETFPGNTNDVTCFKLMVEKMVVEYEIDRVILVGDRGMISHKNIELLEMLGLEYVLGYRMRTIPVSDRAEILGKANLKTLKENQLEFKEVEYQNKRLLVCYNPERAQLDFDHREHILEKLRDKIKSGKIQSIIENKDYIRYLDIEGKAPQLSDKKIKTDELYDGVYVLTSNAKLTGSQAIEAYKGLWQVEQGFRQLKSELEAGPIYHYTDERIRAHIMVCFLALVLRRFLAIKLKKYSKEASYADCLADLKRVHVAELKIKQEEVHLLTEMKEGAKKLFKCLGTPLPEKIIYQSSRLPIFVVPRFPEI